MKDEFRRSTHVESDPVTGGLEEWEAKLLDDNSQPELYDTLEVLDLKDKLNAVAKSVIVVYIALGLLNLEVVRMLFQGVMLSPSEIMRNSSNTLFTILSIGIQIAVLYFPLKALSHILRILMEIEFNSRRVK